MRTQHPMVGRELGNYVIRGLLGEGGMGAVFAGEHKFLGDRVAIKVLHGTYANNQSITERFFQEAKSARDIGHPSIIKILDFGQSPDGGLYLVMELLEGQSLAAVMSRAPLSEDTAVRIGAAIAEGLAAAHQKGIVHRDLKPDNVFICGDQVKILDFGIAKVMAGAGRTGTGAVLGTPRYMAPEQARGAKNVGPHSDVWALGVILYQMLTGVAPFDAEEAMGILVKVISETPPRPGTLVNVSPRMDALVMRCLEKDPAQRVATMADLWMALSQMAGPGVLRVSSDSPTISAPRLALGGTGGTTLSESAGQVLGGEGASRRRGFTIAGAAAGGIAILGISAFFLFRTGSAPVPTAVITTPLPGKAQPAAPGTPAVTEPAAAAAVAPAEEARSTARIVVVRSTPKEATVLIDGKEVGKTPKVLKNISLPANIELKLKGYAPVAEVLSQSMIKDDEVMFTLVRPAKATAPTTLPPAPAPAPPPARPTGLRDPFVPTATPAAAPPKTAPSKPKIDDDDSLD